MEYAKVRLTCKGRKDETWTVNSPLDSVEVGSLKENYKRKSRIQLTEDMAWLFNGREIQDDETLCEIGMKYSKENVIMIMKKNTREPLTDQERRALIETRIAKARLADGLILDNEELVVTFKEDRDSSNELSEDDYLDKITKMRDFIKARQRRKDKQISSVKLAEQVENYKGNLEIDDILKDIGEKTIKTTSKPKKGKAKKKRSITKAGQKESYQEYIEEVVVDHQQNYSNLKVNEVEFLAESSIELHDDTLDLCSWEKVFNGSKKKSKVPGKERKSPTAKQNYVVKSLEESWPTLESVSIKKKIAISDEKKNKDEANCNADMNEGKLKSPVAGQSLYLEIKSELQNIEKIGDQTQNGSTKLLVSSKTQLTKSPVPQKSQDEDIKSQIGGQTRHVETKILVSDQTQNRETKPSEFACPIKTCPLVSDVVPFGSKTNPANNFQTPKFEEQVKLSVDYENESFLNSGETKNFDHGLLIDGVKLDVSDEEDQCTGISGEVAELQSSLGIAQDEGGIKVELTEDELTLQRNSMPEETFTLPDDVSRRDSNGLIETRLNSMPEGEVSGKLINHLSLEDRDDLVFLQPNLIQVKADISTPSEDVNGECPISSEISDLSSSIQSTIPEEALPVISQPNCSLEPTSPPPQIGIPSSPLEQSEPKEAKDVDQASKIPDHRLSETSPVEQSEPKQAVDVDQASNTPDHILSETSPLEQSEPKLAIDIDQARKIPDHRLSETPVSISLPDFGLETTETTTYADDNAREGSLERPHYHAHPQPLISLIVPKNQKDLTINDQPDFSPQHSDELLVSHETPETVQQTVYLQPLMFFCVPPTPQFPYIPESQVNVAASQEQQSRPSLQPREFSSAPEGSHLPQAFSSVIGSSLQNQAVPGAHGGFLQNNAVPGAPGGFLQNNAVPGAPGGFLQNNAVSGASGGFLPNHAFSGAPGGFLHNNAVSGATGGSLLNYAFSGAPGGFLPNYAFSSAPGGSLQPPGFPVGTHQSYGILGTSYQSNVFPVTSQKHHGFTATSNAFSGAPGEFLQPPFPYLSQSFPDATQASLLLNLPPEQKAAGCQQFEEQNVPEVNVQNPQLPSQQHMLPSVHPQFLYMQHQLVPVHPQQVPVVQQQQQFSSVQELLPPVQQQKLPVLNNQQQLHSDQWHLPSVHDQQMGVILPQQQQLCVVPQLQQIPSVQNQYQQLHDMPQLQQSPCVHYQQQLYGDTPIQGQHLSVDQLSSKPSQQISANLPHQEQDILPVSQF